MKGTEGKKEVEHPIPCDDYGCDYCQKKVADARAEIEEERREREGE